MGIFLTFLGAVSMYLKDAAMGKTPRSPKDPEFIAEAVLTGGALGIQSEYVIRALTKSKNATEFTKNVATLSSPTLSVIGEAAAPFAYTVKDLLSKHHKLTTDTKLAGVKAITDMPLGVGNLFYTKMIYDYYLRNGLMEWAKHGYTDSLRGYTRKNPGLFNKHQDYFLARPTKKPFEKPFLGAGE